MSRLSGLIVLGAIFVVSEPVFGHGLDEPLGADAALFVDEELVGIGTNYGLLTPANSGAWAWTPEEVLDAEIRAWRAVDTTTFEVGTTDGLYRTTDRGCSWEPFGLQGVVVSAFANATCSDGVHLAAVEAPSGPGGVYRYGDSGWQPTELESEEVLVSALSCSETECVAGGFIRGDGAALWRSRDCGTSWNPIDVGLDNTIRAVSVDAAARVVVAVRDDEGTRWFELDESDELIAEGTLESALTSIAPVPVHTWHAADDDNTEWLLPGEPVDQGVRSVRAESVGLVRCLDRSHGDLHIEVRSEDGVAMPLVPFSAVQPAACPAGSDGALWVDSLWPVIRELGVGAEDEPSGPFDSERSGCGCDSTGRPSRPAAIALLGFALALWRRVGVEPRATRSKHPGACAGGWARP